MLKNLVISICFFSLISHSNGQNPVQITQPYKFNTWITVKDSLRSARGVFDSTLQLPTGCGIPYGTKYLKGGNTKKSAFYYDSCGNKLYVYDPSILLWRLAEKNISNSSLTATGDYVQNWNHKQFRIDSINHLQFDAFETDSTSFSDEPPTKVHNSIQMHPRLWADSSINLTSLVRNPDDTRDSITSRVSVWSNGAILSMKNDFGTFWAGPNSNAVSLSAYSFNGDWETSPSSSIQVTPDRMDIRSSSGEFYIEDLRPADPVHLNNPIVYDYYTKRIAFLDKPVPISYALTSSVKVSGTLNETSIMGSGFGSLVIPASTWKPGKSYRVTVVGTYTGNNASLLDFTLRLHIGNTTVATTASQNFTGSVGQFSATVSFTCGTTGPSGTVYALGTLLRDNSIFTWNNGLSEAGIPNVAIINMTTDQMVDVTAQLNDASSANSVSAYIVTLEEIN